MGIVPMERNPSGGAARAPKPSETLIANLFTNYGMVREAVRDARSCNVCSNSLFITHLR